MSDAGPPSWLACGLESVDSGLVWLHGDEITRFQAMQFTKRRSEALLGRWTAKQAIARFLGMSLAPSSLNGIVVRNASDGAPEAHVHGQPAPLTIAMTDRADWAVCAIVDGAGRIGCDLELVEPRSQRFAADYFTDAEQQLLAGHAGEEHLVSNLIWSAKESALKVLRSGLRRDTRTVEVALEEDLAADGWQRLTVTVDATKMLPGWWTRCGDFVLTSCSEVLRPPPVSLVKPSPLAGAVPTHAWLGHLMVEP